MGEKQEQFGVRAIVAKAAKDKAFRTQLETEPKVAIEKAFGVELPKDLEIKLHQNSAHVLNLVLPQMPPEGLRTVSDADLQQVAGGLRSSGGTWESSLTVCKTASLVCP
jgi:hypothetical protein